MGKKIYLAAPQVFSRIGETFVREKLQPALQEAGHDPVYPKDLDDGEIVEILGEELGIERAEKLSEWAEEVGSKNAGAIEEADIVLANLDGADVDSGTAAEIGHAYSAGKTIIGYRTDTRSSGENEGVIINLQVEYFIRESGGAVIAPDSYGNKWSAEHHKLYSNPDNLIDLIKEALEEV
ncbi:MAG: nucleoside 2-deoxyribosyltransferase [Candidatus Nanohaloarchaea archaeon]